MASVCRSPGCHTLVRDGSGFCAKHPNTWSRNQYARRTQEAGRVISGEARKEARRQLLQDQPLCVECLRHDRVTPATQRDHIIPIGEGGQDATENTQPLCNDCHQTKSREESRRAQMKLSSDYEERRLPRDLRPSRIPLVVVCGPSGSGKTSYVAEHAGPHDLVIDLDVILQGLAGTGQREPYLRQALEQRNLLLRSLAVNTKHERAWFIVAAPEPEERALWHSMLGGELLVLDTTLDECLKRIDSTGASINERDRRRAAARAWFARNLERAPRSDPWTLA